MPDMNHNIDRTHGFEPLTVEGALPNALRGTLYRVGPGLVQRFGHEVHPFLADGLITAVEVSSTPKGACEMVRSDRFTEEEAAGKPLYSPEASLPRRVMNGLTGKIKNTGNTNILAWQDKLYALMEQGQPVEFDSENLDTVGTNDLGVIKGSFSAHPHRVPALKTTFNFGIHRKDIIIYALPDSGKIRVLAKVEAPWASLIHDFCVTKKHALFFIDPSKMVLWRAMLGTKDFSKYFYWDKNESSTIIIVPLDAPENQTRIEVDPFRVWHFANAYERGGEIVVDAFRHKNIDVITAPTTADSRIPEPKLFRFTLNPAKGQMKAEQLMELNCEFPIVNPAYIGTVHDTVWMQSYDDRHGTQGITRFDVETTTTRRYFAPTDHLVSEPMYVHGGAAEDDGWLLQLTQDVAEKKSYLGVFNAHSFEDGPVAKLWFDQRIPATFHGIFLPEG